MALKDGFIDFNPGSTFTDQTGFANIGGGLKYAFLLDPANQLAASFTASFEIPLGNTDVFQGEGDGNVNLSVQAVKLEGSWQFAGAAGLQIPIDSSFSTQGWVSGHVSYYASRWFIPFVEANLFTVLEEGDGGTRFDDQVGGAVPALAPSEGADLINFGAANSETFVTLGLGFRTELTENLSLGFAYEFPLTDEEDNITRDRLNFDALFTF